MQTRRAQYTLMSSSRTTRDTDSVQFGAICDTAMQHVHTSVFLDKMTLFFFSFSRWGETESTWYVGHCWPIVPAPYDR
jgi:hypothetical protein